MPSASSSLTPRAVSGAPWAVWDSVGVRLRGAVADLARAGSAQAGMDYREESLVCKSAHGPSVPITPAVVVGKAVELSWRLSYRPAIGCLPIPTECQQPKDLATADFSNVMKNGVGRPHQRMPIKVYPQDAKKAIEISRGVLDKLRRGPYNLQVLTADHTGPSGKEAHDLLLATQGHLHSQLDEGLYSLELVCREVKDPRAFDWAGELSREALPLWQAERPLSRVLRGRILVLAQMTNPCHKGDFSLHGLLATGGSPQWERLFGWGGFSLRSISAASGVPAATLPSSASDSVAVARRGAPASASSSSPAPALSNNAKWTQLKAKLGSHGHAGWYALTDFLVQVKEHKGHSARFVCAKEKGKRLWVLDGGRRPKVKQDWDKKPTKNGGGHGGVIFCREKFLKDVFDKHYASKYTP